jgi:hypothetical protein
VASKEKSELQQLRKLNPHLARPLSGLASQIYGLDEKGKAKVGATPGIVNEILSLPTLLPSLSWLVAKLGGGLGPGRAFPRTADIIAQNMERLVPGASHEAEAEQTALREAVRREAGLKAPSGFVEGAEDALGTMLGQLPIGAAKKVGSMGRVVGALPEYLLPTVRPSIGAYTSGSVAGGVANLLADEEEEHKARGGYMPSVSRRQAGLMAAAAHDPEIARRRGIPMSVAREFNRADRSQPTQRFGQGGLAKFLQQVRNQRGMTTSITMQPKGRMRNDALMLSPSDYLSYGTGPAQSFYSQMQGSGQAMSPFAGTDKKVGRAMKDLGRLTQKMADGGKVAMSQKALHAVKDAISHLQGRDRARAVETLRASREALAHPGVGGAHRALATDSGIGPATKVLNKLVEEAGNVRGVPALADGGEVEMEMGAAPEQMQDAQPAALYAEYVQLVQQLEQGALEEDQQMAVITRLQQIEGALEALGIDVVGDGAMEEGMGAEGGDVMPV